MSSPKRGAEAEIDQLAQARAAFESGRLRHAHELIESSEMPKDWPERLLLLSRIALARDDAAEVIDVLSARSFPGRRLEAMRLLLLAGAHARTPDYKLAGEYFERSHTHALRDGDAQLLAEIACRRGEAALWADEPTVARRHLESAMQSPSPLCRLEALWLESGILEKERRPRAQADALHALLLQIDPQDERFATLAAQAARSLSELACEMPLAHAAAAVERHLHDCTWPEDLNAARFHCLRSLAWSYALRGDDFTAFRHLREGTRYAPSQAWYAIALLDRSYLARALGEERWSRQELYEAEETAARVDWFAASDEERLALLLLAAMFAPLDSGKASQFLIRHGELMQATRPAGERNAALGALADDAVGVTHLVLRDTNGAVAPLARSLRFFEAAQHDWRAGRCALRLYEATGDRSYLYLAGEKLRHYPNSWLAQEVRERMRVRDTGPTLPAMQRRVLEQLRRGLSTGEIAGQFGRSEHTIKNHIKLIFKAYGVKTRAQLLALTNLSS